MDTAANRCEWTMESTAERTIGVMRAKLAATERQLAAAEERAERAERERDRYRDALQRIAGMERVLSLGQAVEVAQKALAYLDNPVIGGAL